MSEVGGICRPTAKKRAADITVKRIERREGQWGGVRGERGVLPRRIVQWNSKEGEKGKGPGKIRKKDFQSNGPCTRKRTTGAGKKKRY